MKLKPILENKKTIYYILFIQLIIRIIVASYSTLGNDEVYYTLYAKYLDIAYFDHPPMVGWLLWLTTFGYQLHHEFFIRLGALLLGSGTIFILYKIGVLLKNHIAGNIIALLASSSFYIAIISGTFIMPDTPLSFFWVVSIWTFLLYIKNKKNFNLLIFGVFVGLALLSKYHALYLWIGAGIYFMLNDKKQFKNPYVYISGLISLAVFSPVIFWNMNSDYSGFGYHGNRIGSGSYLPNFKHFFPEFFGQLFYNNPFNVLLIVFSILYAKKNKIKFNSSLLFLLCVSLPLIATTLLMAMYNKTLPHWSGPSYFGLLIIAGYFLSERGFYLIKRNSVFIKGSVFLFLLIIVVGMFQIRTGLLLGNHEISADKLGKDDFTIDLAQWKKIGNGLEHELPKNSTIITHNWFPAAHITHYYAENNHAKVYVFGQPEKQHQFLKINKDQGEIPIGSSVYFISTSHYYREPSKELIKKFTSISSRKKITIKVYNRKKVNVFIWRLDGLHENLFK